eukprot:COSAG01_NODE_1510_length_10078_cov_424.420910_2_plen_81_part_00
MTGALHVRNFPAKKVLGLLRSLGSSASASVLLLWLAAHCWMGCCPQSVVVGRIHCCSACAAVPLCRGWRLASCCRRPASR